STSVLMLWTKSQALSLKLSARSLWLTGLPRRTQTLALIWRLLATALLKQLRLSMVLVELAGCFAGSVRSLTYKKATRRTISKRTTQMMSTLNFS
ncbi:hypothetical protein GGH17_005359, partial [Coemansia sp. RSA 788]